MKKLLMVTTLAMVAGAPVAMAQGPGGMDGNGPGRHKNPERMIEMIFSRHDVDKDGVITKEEFLKEAEARFVKMDADSDGKVTKEEVKTHAEAMKEKFENRKGDDNTPPPPPPAEE